MGDKEFNKLNQAGSKIRKRRPKLKKKTNIIGTITASVMLAGAILPVVPAITTYADSTFAAIAPTIASVTATEAGDFEVGAGAGDTVTIVFDTPTNTPIMIHRISKPILQ